MTTKAYLAAIREMDAAADRYRRAIREEAFRRAESEGAEVLTTEHVRQAVETSKGGK